MGELVERVKRSAWRRTGAKARGERRIWLSFQTIFTKPRRGVPTLAQGNALGNATPFHKALKGRSNPDPWWLRALVRPFRAFIRLAL